MDVEGQIPPILPLQKGGIPLFGKEGLALLDTASPVHLWPNGNLSNRVKGDFCNDVSSQLWTP